MKKLRLVKVITDCVGQFHHSTLLFVRRSALKSGWISTTKNQRTNGVGAVWDFILLENRKSLSEVPCSRKKLTVYLDHAFLEIDNNLIENAIRPTVLGRKNYLFSGSHEGKLRSEIIYSFHGTCKMNDVNPKEWLADVLLRLPDTKTS